jgi:hypothetical protein
MPINVGNIGAVSDSAKSISSDSAGTARLPTDQKREYNAGYIGIAIVAIFGITIFYLLHLGALLFTKFNATNFNDFAGFVTGSLNPFLKECATTVGTIFGSTLGFVLGYYFKASSTPASTTNHNA